MEIRRCRKDLEANQFVIIRVISGYHLWMAFFPGISKNLHEFARMNTHREYMNLVASILFLIFSIIIFNSCTDQDTRSNIIYILADDLGYAELGCYGQEKIETPNIDKLAEEGIRFTNFYTGSPVCAPSRCILLTGQHSGHAYIRGNDEVGSRGDVWSYYAMAHDPGLEGQRPLADSIVTIAEKLQETGYRTALFGKWGLGYPGSESTPNKQGFDYFFGYNCQRQAHVLTPLHLWRNEERVHLRNDTIPPRTPLDEDADPYDPTSYAKYDQPDYAPTVIFEDLMRYIDQLGSEPFCVFWESPIPHVPLQAPKKWIDHYVNKFGDEEPYLGDKGYFPTRYPRATYAAMISYLDENVGKLVNLLKEKGLYENTLIMFTSDNGPSYAGGADSDFFDSAKPYRSDRGWGKGSLREGGVKVPLIASWPERITARTTTNHISSSQDIFPTLCDLGGIEYIRESVDGISFLPTLLAKNKQKEHKHLYWEFSESGGQQAVRMGNMKVYVDSIHHGKYNIRLYDLETDPLEETDIADIHTEVVSEMKSILIREHKKSFNPRWQFEVLDGM